MKCTPNLRIATVGLVVALACGIVGNRAPSSEAAVLSGILPNASHPTLELWLDASTLPTGPPTVGLWQDQSSKGNDASQVSPTLQPAYVAANAAFTTWPTVHFDGTDDVMTSALASVMSITGTSPRTILVAFKQDVLASKNVVGYGANANGQLFDVLLTTQEFGGHFYGGGNDTYGATTQTYTPGQLTLGMISYDGTTVRTYQHDASVNTQLASVNLALNTGDSAFTIGSGLYAPYSYFNGDIAEVLVYSEVLSPQDLAGVDNYLFTKYTTTPAAFALLLVPEPSSGLLMLGLAGLFALRRRRRVARG